MGSSPIMRTMEQPLQFTHQQVEKLNYNTVKHNRASTLQDPNRS